MIDRDARMKAFQCTAIPSQGGDFAYMLCLRVLTVIPVVVARTRVVVHCTTGALMIYAYILKDERPSRTNEDECWAARENLPRLLSTTPTKESLSASGRRDSTRVQKRKSFTPVTISDA